MNKMRNQFAGYFRGVSSPVTLKFGPVYGDYFLQNTVIAHGQMMK
jgi:hypothetical protein